MLMNFTNICEHLSYANTNVINIEKETKGHYKKPNRHLMRKGLITASKIKAICKFTNYIKQLNVWPWKYWVLSFQNLWQLELVRKLCEISRSAFGILTFLVNFFQFFCTSAFVYIFAIYTEFIISGSSGHWNGWCNHALLTVNRTRFTT